MGVLGYLLARDAARLVTRAAWPRGLDPGRTVVHVHLVPTEEPTMKKPPPVRSQTFTGDRDLGLSPGDLESAAAVAVAARDAGRPVTIRARVSVHGVVRSITVEERA